MIISTFCNPAQTQVSIAEQSRPLSNKGDVDSRFRTQTSRKDEPGFDTTNVSI